MKCPNCGAELEDGKLICEKCATEINYVPDFEPEIENTIKESLSDITVALDDTSAYESPLSKDISKILSESNDIGVDIPDELAITKKVVVKRGHFIAEEDIDDIPDEDLDKELESYLDDEFDDIPDDLPDDSFWDVDEVIKFSKEHNLFKKGKSNTITKVVFIAGGFAVVCMLVLLVAFFMNVSKKNSYSYLLEMADKEFQAGNYLTAVDYMESAVNKSESTDADNIKLADYYLSAEMYENAEAIYLDLVNKTNGEDLSYYEKLFLTYEKEQKYQSIYKICIENESPEFKEYFNKYYADVPIFSDIEGTYDDVLYLKISGNTSGKIYYTLDGSTPDSNSREYTSPLFLESGYYRINAIFINDYGFISDVVTANYNINVVQISPPEINLESGNYTSGNIIVVTNLNSYMEDIETPVHVYYTTDGSTPSVECLEYTEPIILPFGNTRFAFIAIDEASHSSEIVEYEYNFDLPSFNVSRDEAIWQVFNYRYSLGGIDDYEGHVSTLGGRLYYVCDACINLNGIDYLAVTEMYEDPVSGLSQKTGNIYGVSNADINDFGLIVRDENGNYSLRR